MFPDFHEQVVRDRQRQRLHDAAADRRARDAAPREPLPVRAAEARRALGFRLVEAGLRLALADAGGATVTSRPPRSASSP